MKKLTQIGALAGAVLLTLGGAVGLVQQQANAMVVFHLAAGALLLLAGLVINWGNTLEFLNRTGLKWGPQVVVQGALLLVVLLFVNIIVYQNDVGRDFTRIRLFTLRPATRVVLNNLPGEVRIMAFFPGGGPTEARERLKLYSRFPNVKLTFIDPDKNEEIARAEGIPPQAGILFKHGQETMWITGYQEQDITNAIIKVSRAIKPLVWFVTGHGEPTIDSDQPDGLSVLKGMLEEQGYKAESIDLPKVVEIPDEVSTVVMAGLAQPLSRRELEMLDAYLYKGGNAFILLDPVLDSQLVSGLETFLEFYGIRTGWDVIRDPVNRLAEDEAGTWIVLNEVSKYHPVTNNFSENRLVMYYARSLYELEKKPTEIKVTSLVESSENSFAKAIPLEFLQTVQTAEQKQAMFKNILQQGPQPGEPMGPIPVAFAVERVPKEKRWLGDDAPRITRMVVVGSSSIARNRVITIPYNWEFALNAMNWLAGEKDLAIIKAPKRGGTQLDLDKKQKDRILYISVMILPEFFMIVGLAVWWRRR